VTRMSDFEQAALEKLLAGDHPTLADLRIQAREARIVSREVTGFGFFLEFEVPLHVPSLPASTSDFQVDDVYAVLDELRWGAGFILSVRAGRLDILEGYSVGEPWPRRIDSFQLVYEWEPRRLKLPKTAPEIWPG
jgi:hypothetical protein